MEKTNQECQVCKLNTLLELYGLNDSVIALYPQYIGSLVSVNLPAMY